MRKALAFCASVLTILAVGELSAAERKPAPSGANAYIIYPADGQVIPGGKVWVRMGLSPTMGVAPAGVKKENTGHHHLLVNVDERTLDFSAEIPNDKNHLHFGKGQTEARLELPPGRHTIWMLLGDENHVPHDPPVRSRVITVTVPNE